MTRLIVVAEGQSEGVFITQILRPHLEEHGLGRILVFAPVLRGHYTFASLKKFVLNCLGARDSVVVTTMIDLYKIAPDLPGLEKSLDDAPPQQRVQYLERRLSEEIDYRRFRPYIQLHEFEALVLTDLAVLAEQYPKLEKDLKELGARLRKQFPTPEHVNRVTPPSRRILQVAPEYDKKLDGVAALAKIGLPTLRARCPHFGDWCNFLETVG
jgi:hypothetical protein